jgi:hypothetical protein
MEGPNALRADKKNKARFPGAADSRRLSLGYDLTCVVVRKEASECLCADISCTHVQLRVVGNEHQQLVAEILRLELVCATTNITYYREIIEEGV